MMGCYACELTAAMASHTRPTEGQARGHPSLEKGGIHETSPLVKELFVADGL